MTHQFSENQLNTVLSKKLNPPYFSVAKLDKTIELISTRNFSEITTSLFVGYGFGETDALLAVNTLRFLGIIDESNKPTSNIQKLRLKGEAKKSAFEAIVKEAYKKLFDVVAEPQNLSDDDLNNEFVAHYHLSGRLVKTAIPVFKRLLEYAGMKEEGSVITRKREPKANTQTKKSPRSKDKELPLIDAGSAKIVEQQIDQSFSSTPVADGRLILSLPKDLKDRLLDDEALNADWFVLQKTAKSFADKHIPKKA